MFKKDVNQSLDIFVSNLNVPFLDIPTQRQCSLRTDSTRKTFIPGGVPIVEDTSLAVNLVLHDDLRNVLLGLVPEPAVYHPHVHDGSGLVTGSDNYTE